MPTFYYVTLSVCFSFLIFVACVNDMFYSTEHLERCGAIFISIIGVGCLLEDLDRLNVQDLNIFKVIVGPF